MLKINRQTDYAVRVVLALARLHGNTRLSTIQIQHQMFVPPAFLTRIVAELVRAGLVKSYPGRDGGLQLARPGSEITLKDVVEAIEGPLELSQCLRQDSDCPLRRPCPVLSCWGRLQAAILQELAGTSFADLAAQSV